MTTSRQHNGGAGIRRSRPWFTTAAAMFVACIAPQSAQPEAGPAFADSSFYANFEGHALTDQEGRRFLMASLKGKALLVNFVYTGCSTTCPLQTRALAEVQRALPASTAPRLQFVSVSIDPLGDTPSALKAFAQRMNADLSRWTFATGRPHDIERLSERLRLFGRDPQQTVQADQHATTLWLVDRQGRLRQRYSGAPPDVPRLVRELNQLVANADPA